MAQDKNFEFLRAIATREQDHPLQQPGTYANEQARAASKPK
jgi:hypothetical protein